MERKEAQHDIYHDQSSYLSILSQCDANDFHETVNFMNMDCQNLDLSQEECENSCVKRPMNSHSVFLGYPEKIKER